MATYLKIGTVDLNNNINYRLAPGWRPRVARRRVSGLAGWLYEDVTEDIPVQIFSTNSLADCLDARDAVINALDQAHRWRYGEAVSAVLFKYRVDGSVLSNPLQAEVLSGSGDDLIRLEPTFNRDIRAWIIEATISLLRRGDLLGDEDTPTDASAAQPAVVTITFAESVPLYSPVTIKASNIDYQNQNGINIPKGLWFVASAATRLLLLQGEARSTSGATTSTAAAVVDANASGGNYLEFDHGEDGYWNLSTSDIVGDLIGVYAMCNQTSGSAVWKLTTQIYREATSGINLDQVVTIPGEAPGYEPVRLGVLSRADDKFTLHIQAILLSGSGKFNVDYLVLIALGAPGERVIGFNQMSGILPYTGLPGDIVDRRMIVDNRRLVAQRPNFQLQETSGGVLVTTISYEADIHLASIGDKLYWLQMAAGSNGTWLWLDDASTSRTITATRRRAYLAPR